jgi:hypothetical protein
MRSSVKTALIAAIVSALVAAGAAVATTKTFVLGTTNTVDAASTVTAGTNGINSKMIQLTNNSTGSSATALGLTTPSSRPPFRVSSSVKVANLNADKLDGLDSTGFVQGGGRILTGSAQVALGDQQAVVDQSHAMPPFSVTYICPTGSGDGSGDTQFVNRSSTTLAYVVATGIDKFGVHAFGLPVGAGSFIGIAADWGGAKVEYSAHWLDGHAADVSLFSFDVSGSADPRNDGCYVQWTATVK